ncbi:MAG: succinate dehydrogenase cytochrome b subunit [Chitinophagales bacterium]|nr:succinate dehydrogenase cytochrome b subunit [Chitinophagales bacterium]MDW8273727.1 succinate dehydrogenase cytochrome b subunit [Chitinophagales bacterium]
MSKVASKSVSSYLFKSSVGKKAIMALSGLFLITFLIVHVGINSLVLLNDGGKTFSEWAHFMGTNPLIRILEIGLVAGFLIHIIDGFLLWKENHDARPVKYAVSNANANSKWYSRSMGLLGTLILLFLIVHTAHFWIPNRANQFATGEELDLYNLMKEAFSKWYNVLIYVAGCFSLFWHLLHGFKSAFQTLGLNHVKYNKLIEIAGIAFSIVVPTLFAIIPIVFYLNIIK